LGSQAVAKVYEEEGVDVKGMIQMDMTGELCLWDLRGMRADGFGSVD
jgi:hypothetical protein